MRPGGFCWPRSGQTCEPSTSLRIQTSKRVSGCSGCIEQHSMYGTVHTIQYLLPPPRGTLHPGTTASQSCWHPPIGCRRQLVLASGPEAPRAGRLASWREPRRGRASGSWRPWPFAPEKPEVRQNRRSWFGRAACMSVSIVRSPISTVYCTYSTVL